MKIEDEIKGLPENFIILVITPLHKFQETTLELLNMLVKKYSKGSYITINKPYQSILKILKSNNINDRNVFFIDCITEYLKEKDAIVGNCKFIDSPANLTDVGITLTPILKDDAYKFLMIDSLDTMMLYNDFGTVVKFAHYITGKLRLHNMSGVLLAVEEKSEEKLINGLGQFCDKVITVD